MVETLRREFRVGAWNQLTLEQSFASPVTLERMGMEISAGSEAKRLGYGMDVAEAYSYHWSGLTDDSVRRVAATISVRLSECFT